MAIEPPELEMRVAILLRKAESEGVPMPEEVAFIAKHLRSNVRELEGALRKVLAYARFHGREALNVDVCKEALKDLLSVSNGQITVENIQKTVADFTRSSGRHVFETPAREYCPSAPGRHVSGQGVDTEKPA